MKRVPVCPRRLVREKVKFQGRLQERLAKFSCFCSRRRHRDRAKVVNRRSRSRKPAAAVAASAWVFRGVAVGGTKCTRFRCDDQNSITRSLSDSEERRERLWAGTFLGGGLRGTCAYFLLLGLSAKSCVRDWVQPPNVGFGKERKSRSSTTVVALCSLLNVDYHAIRTFASVHSTPRVLPHRISDLRL